MRNGARIKKRKTGTVQVELVETGSGNVFADLGVPQSAEALAKAELAGRICGIIADRKLTQSQAAVLLGVDQPKISALLRGKVSGFSSDRLFRFLNALGQDVRIVVRPTRRPGERASTSVVDR
jgi:predicted XRE-type DNA-binding protein